MNYRHSEDSFYNEDGRFVGNLSWGPKGGYLVKTGLDPARHQLHKPPAWCTDSAHLVALRELGARGLRLITTDGRAWEATLDAFECHGIRLERGHGAQVALPLQYWTDTANGYQLGFGFGDAE